MHVLPGAVAAAALQFNSVKGVCTFCTASPAGGLAVLAGVYTLSVPRPTPRLRRPRGHGPHHRGPVRGRARAANTELAGVSVGATFVPDANAKT